ncbi:MAG: hypothetical protein H7A46_26680 [Verrucomicrobiales bacterium]|nr:hypothetical protein [Verrucomicrobiales bacterium]
MNETLRPSHRDPLDVPFEDFDWQELYQRLGEDARNGKIDPDLSDVVVRLLELFLRNRRARRVSLQQVGLRVVALAWVLSPAYFAGSPSLRELAQRCRIDSPSLALCTSRMSRLIRWQNGAQRRRPASQKYKQTTLQVEGCDVGQR